MPRRCSCALCTASPSTSISQLPGLDLTLTNGQNIITSACFSSDHRVCRTLLNYKRADRAGLRAALRLAPWAMLDRLPVEDATELFLRPADFSGAAQTPAAAVFRPRATHSAAGQREEEAAHRRMRKAGTADSRALFSEKRRAFKSSEQFYMFLRFYFNSLVEDLNMQMFVSGCCNILTSPVIGAQPVGD